MSRNWKQGRTGEELKTIGAEAYELERQVLKLITLVFMSVVHALKFQLLDPLAEDFGKVRDMSVLNAPSYDQHYINIETAHRGLFRRRATWMRVTLMLIWYQRSDSQRITSNEGGICL